MRKQWQPIDTAPMDGTYIFAIRNEPGHSRIPCVIAYNLWEDAWADHPAPADMKPVRKVLHQPTHWMPLPDPPDAGGDPPAMTPPPRTKQEDEDEDFETRVDRRN